ncbi:pPIWI_RE_Z domain-containing protein [Azospirillum palustre]
MTRAAGPFLQAYAQKLRACGYATGSAGPSRREVKPLAMIELVCLFVSRHVPGYPIDDALDLMSGYDRVVGVPGTPAARRDYANLRHLCIDLFSTSAFREALRRHRVMPAPHLMCFDTSGGAARPKSPCPAGLLAILERALRECPPYEGTRLVVGTRDRSYETFLRATNGVEVVAGVAVPDLPGLDARIDGRARLAGSRPRRTAPVVIELAEAEIKAACREADAREADPSWPRLLPRLNLVDRWDEVTAVNVSEKGFRTAEGYRLSGRCHVVGMLSARKTTFAWAVTFAVLRQNPKARILVFAKDTVTASAMATRLTAHGIAAVELTSIRRRPVHLRAIHQHTAQFAGSTLGDEGVYVGGMPTGCVLLGFQPDKPTVLRGKSADAVWPELRDVPRRLCGGLTIPGQDAARACPYWVDCGLHHQHRSAPTAQVVLMTPPSFVLTRPDPWICPEDEGNGLERPLWMEAVQDGFDLVIADEADAIQRWFDTIFSRDVVLMDAGSTNWSVFHKGSTIESFASVSGAPFRKRQNHQFCDLDGRLTDMIGRVYHVIEAGENAWLKWALSRRATTGSALMIQYFWQGRPKAEVDRMLAAGVTESAVIASVSQLMDTLSTFAQPDSFRGDFSVRAGGRIDLKRPAAALAALVYEVKEIGACQDLLLRVSEILRDDIDLLDEVIATMIAPALDGVLKPFAWRLRERNGPRERAAALCAQDIVFALFCEELLSTFATHVILADATADEFGTESSRVETVGVGNLRRYRNLLPANPSGAVYGLRYEPPPEDAPERGGRLSVFSTFGPGRHIPLHLHEAREPEGQCGPAVLILSGTSWAGGSIRDEREVTAPDGTSRTVLIDAAAPIYDIQAPVDAILIPPKGEIDAMLGSIVSFARMPVVRESGGVRTLGQVRMSGADPERKKEVLDHIARQLGEASGGQNLFERNWEAAGKEWGEGLVEGRRRALCVTNSYADALHFADRLTESLGFAQGDWKVFVAIPDDDSDELFRMPRRAIPLPRSLMEDFGTSPERSVLVAPMSVIDRGHNIVVPHVLPDGRTRMRAAIASVYFLHRTHPRPDDIEPVVARLNRFAVEMHDNGLDLTSPVHERAARRTAHMTPAGHRSAVAMRLAARDLYYEAMAWRVGFSTLREEEKAQFAWNWLTSFWQTVGRLVRGGVPAQVILVDAAFAPGFFGSGRGADDRNTSVILRALYELERARLREPRVTDLLYRPLLEILRKAERLMT